MLWSEWRRRRRQAKEARLALEDALHDPEVLAGTSLRPRHASRYIILGTERQDGHLTEVHFGVVRHPRPYPFSSQHHRVAELWVYDVMARKLRVVRGDNWTRASGRDDD